jgi:hypothetical protein
MRRARRKDVFIAIEEPMREMTTGNRVSTSTTFHIQLAAAGKSATAVVCGKEREASKAKQRVLNLLLLLSGQSLQRRQRVGLQPEPNITHVAQSVSTPDAEPTHHVRFDPKPQPVVADVQAHAEVDRKKKGQGQLHDFVAKRLHHLCGDQSVKKVSVRARVPVSKT